jgi:hypothetical protein
MAVAVVSLNAATAQWRCRAYAAFFFFHFSCLSFFFFFLIIAHYRGENGRKFVVTNKQIAQN